MQRVGAARGDVVDAVRGEVGAAVAEAPALARERSASCRRRRSRPRAAARRRAGAGPANAPNPCAPVDSTAARSRSTTDAGRRERDAGGAVAVRRNHQAGSLRARVSRTARRRAPAGLPGRRAGTARASRRPGPSPPRDLEPEEVAERGRLHLAARRRAAAARLRRSTSRARSSSSSIQSRGGWTSSR